MIMEILGHSQIGVTMNTYSHVQLELQQEAANLMDGFLRQVVSGSARPWYSGSERSPLKRQRL